MKLVVLCVLVIFGAIGCSSVNKTDDQERLPSSMNQPDSAEVLVRKSVDNLRSAKKLGLEEFLKTPEGQRQAEELLRIKNLSHELVESVIDWYNQLPRSEQKDIMLEGR